MEVCDVFVANTGNDVRHVGMLIGAARLLRVRVRVRVRLTRSSS